MSEETKYDRLVCWVFDQDIDAYLLRKHLFLSSRSVQKTLVDTVTESFDWKSVKTNEEARLHNRDNREIFEISMEIPPQTLAELEPLGERVSKRLVKQFDLPFADSIWVKAYSFKVDVDRNEDRTLTCNLEVIPPVFVKYGRMFISTPR